LSDEDKSRINPFDWNSKSTGFGEIIANGGFDVVIGNPPYGAELTPQIKEYLVKKYVHQNYQFDKLSSFHGKDHRAFAGERIFGNDYSYG